MSYEGSCHCGRVTFRVQGEPAGAMACNCSICRRKGSLLWFVPREDFELLTPERDASSYRFNTHVIRHRFCPACGIHPYADGAAPDGRPMTAVNLRCIEEIDLDAIPVTHYDGRAH
ncbi:GFA family protein [Burkholderia gladioli]|uniref:GFA family protein n=1 Tax=Burkholderia gladioli TaxID=28095 RepID=UPI000F52CDDD|nr:GFA family protein [Burkholderia gladioli]